MSNQGGVKALNMTNFFNRELFMYSLGDIRFRKPVSLKKVAYLMAFLLCWTLPIILIFGIHINILYAALVLAPPFVFANVAVKPRFGGKSLLDFIRSAFGFLSEPKGWADLKASKNLDKDTYFVESEIWVSRRREMQYLADLYDEERANNG